MSQNKLSIESTLKSKDTEEYLDIIFYRPFGYVIALLSKKLGLTPNGVTILSLLLGVVAGHLFYYNNFIINLIGVVILIVSEACDSADGQLARMTNNHSRFGRILDGLASNFTFLSIYIHVCLRLINVGFSPTIFIVAILAGISHSCQSAIGDYGRNFYMYFVYGKEKSEIDDSATLIKNYPALSWTRNFVKKFLMRVYINYTVQQEFLSGSALKLFRVCYEKYGINIPEKISQEYKDKNKRLIKYYNTLTTNTRMIVLCIAVLTNYAWAYFLFELTLMNILMMYVMIKHEQNNGTLLNEAVIAGGKI